MSGANCSQCGSVTVVNIKNDPDGDYIGRANPKAKKAASPLCNEKKIEPGTSRAEVIAWYENWLNERLQEDGPERAALDDLIRRYQSGEDIKLVCWCKPKACHGDVVKRLIEAAPMANPRRFNPDASEAIPAALRERAQWIVWLEVPKDNGKADKVPQHPTDNYNIDGMDPANFMPFDEAVAAFQANPKLSGIGYSITPDDNITGIDMDACRDPDSGQLLDWAKRHVEQFGSYAEVSPSGTGVRIIAEGKPPAGHPQRQGHRELYSQGRFLTITGNAIANAGELAQAPEAVNQYIAAMLREKPADEPHSASGGLSELVAEYRNNTLTKEAGWLRRHGYTQAEIEALLMTVNANRCKPPLDHAEVCKIARSVAKYQPADDAFASPDPITLPIVSLTGLGDLHIDPVPEIVERILPATVATILAAHGGTGKTMLALEMAVCVAAGREFMGLAVTQCPVTFYSAEDDARILLIRLQRIMKHYGIDPDEIADRLQIIDATGIDPALFREANIKDDQGTSRRGITTQAYQALTDAAKGNGSRLLIVDNASDVFEANENERQRVRQFVRSLSSIAREIDGAVLLLSHVDKNTAKAGGSSEGYSGSTAWHNSARSRLFLSDDGDYLKLEHQKANHGPKADDIPLSWSDGLLVPGEQSDPSNPARQLIDGRNQKQILNMIQERAERGQFISTSPTAGNAWVTLSAFDEFPKVKKKEFWRLMDQAEKAGHLIREKYRDGKREEKSRFSVTESGSNYCVTVEAGS